MPTYNVDRYFLGTSGAERLMSSNDASISHNGEDVASEVRLQGGSLVRYPRKKILHWMFQYRYIYGKDRDVFDLGMGRDSLYALWQTDVSYSFGEPQSNAAVLFYTVKFELNSYREQLLFRSGDVFAYQLSFSLVQVT